MPISSPSTADLENKLIASDAATTSHPSLDEELHAKLGPGSADAGRDTALTTSSQETNTAASGNMNSTPKHVSQINDSPRLGHSPQRCDDASLHGFDTISQHTESTCVVHALSPNSTICDPLLDSRQNADSHANVIVESYSGPACEEQLSRAPLSPSHTAVYSCDESLGQQIATFTPPPDSMSSEADCPVFDEWPLQDVTLKRVIIDGVAVVQLQFQWPLCATHAGSGGMQGKFGAPRWGATRRQASGVPNRRSRFTPEEDMLLRSLKETSNSWREIHRQFSAQFPGRTSGALQVRYCTKLKGV